MEPTQTRECIAQAIVDLVEASFPVAGEGREALLAQARALVEMADPNTAPQIHAIPETPLTGGEDALAPPRNEATLPNPSALQPDSRPVVVDDPAPTGVSEPILSHPAASDTVPSEAPPREPSALQPDSHPITTGSVEPDSLSEPMLSHPAASDTVPSEAPPQEPSALQPDSHPLTTESVEPDSLSEPKLSQPDPQESVVASLRPGEIPAVALPVAPVPTPPPRVEIMANARAGTPYRAHVIAHVEEGSAHVLDCEIPAEAMVSFQDGHLCGESPRAGEYDIQVSVAVGPSRIVRTQARLVVNPDPRSLWQNIPSDRDAPGWKPDGDVAHLEGAGSRRLVVASQRGRSHAHVGAARDDDFVVRGNAADGWNILAVADGAGSAKRSRIGSRVACETAVDVAAEQLAETADQWPLDRLAYPPSDESGPVLRNLAYRVLGAAAFEAVKDIQALAEAEKGEPRDYATTLLLALHRPLQSGDLIVTIWVGDGAIGLLEADGSSRLLGTPDGGAYAGQTRFLDREIVTDGQQIMRRIQVAVVPHLEALILMSDGVSDPIFPSDAALLETTRWRGLWSELQPRLAQTQAQMRLLEWLDFWSSGNHDDRTVAVLF